jgi:hypothetical protein
MLRNKASVKKSSGFCSGILLAAIGISLGAQSAAAAFDKYKAAAPIVHRAHHNLYARYRAPQLARPEALPYGPEYGFLRSVPPNAIRMPGYTFVPGAGILGESCDLPTSACTNEYRDVQ